MPGASGAPWMLKAVRAGGANAVDDGIEFKAGENVDGIEIELTSHAPLLTGTVHDATGNAVVGSSVLLFPADRQQWTTPTTRHFAASRTDQNGQFKTSTLPPGNYYALALDGQEPGDWQDPDYLETLRRDATEFSLSEGETKTLNLKWLAEAPAR
jgi:hypothetical protein